MSSHRLPFLRLALMTGVLAAAGPALAAPRVGIVVLGHEGLTDEQTDEIAYDIAGAIASQIEGEALAGASVRDALTDPIASGCEQQPACGRKVAATLKTDEVLFLQLRKGAKKDVQVLAWRVARDPEKPGADGTANLAGGKAKRGRAITDLVGALYPRGSVAEYVEPPPPPPAPVVTEVPTTEVETRSKKKAAESDGTPVWKKGWFWGVVAGGVVVVAGAAVGIYFAAQPEPTSPPITLPP